MPLLAELAVTTSCIRPATLRCSSHPPHIQVMGRSNFHPIVPPAARLLSLAALGLGAWQPMNDRRCSSYSSNVWLEQQGEESRSSPNCACAVTHGRYQTCRKRDMMQPGVTFRDESPCRNVCLQRRRYSRSAGYHVAREIHSCTGGIRRTLDRASGRGRVRGRGVWKIVGVVWSATRTGNLKRVNPPLIVLDDEHGLELHR